MTATYWWISSSNSFLKQSNLRRTAETVRKNIPVANFYNSTPTESKTINDYTQHSNIIYLYSGEIIINFQVSTFLQNILVSNVIKTIVIKVVL